MFNRLGYEIIFLPILAILIICVIWSYIRQNSIKCAFDECNITILDETKCDKDSPIGKAYSVNC